MAAPLRRPRSRGYSPLNLVDRLPDRAALPRQQHPLNARGENRISLKLSHLPQARRRMLSRPARPNRALVPPPRGLAVCPWGMVSSGGEQALARASAGKRSLSGIQRKPMNWFLWAAVAAAAAGIVLFTVLWIDVSRGTHTDDRRGAAGATLLAWCMGVATVLGIIGLVVKFW
jgi:hypothetical protein